MKITYIKTGKRLKKKSLLEKLKLKPEKKHEAENAIEVNSEYINRYLNQNNKNESEKKEERKEIFSTIFKKNQIVILTLALMFVTAGYLNYTNNQTEGNEFAEVGDAQLVSTNVYENDVRIEDDNAKETNDIIYLQEKNETAQETAASSDYFTQTRLERDTMYSQMLETYQKILENEKISSDQKQISGEEIKNINNRKNAISIAENLIKTKNFSDVVILLNDNNINVVVKQNENLKTEQVAQISNIISREFKADINDIHISIHK